ncbi:hypothetical protein H0H87_002348 [Tephrocybe sp. NHM501043]|nr:hypothetical protein H0H87_002348 [Tephrocybe sp. NHM501043]
MSSFLRPHAYSPLPPTSSTTARRRPRWLGVAICATALTILLVWAARHFLFGAPPYSPLLNYQHLDPPPLVPTTTSQSTRAVVSTLYSDSYAIGAAVLAYSLRLANTTADHLLLAYIPGRISEEALCIVRAAGWTPTPVAFIPPPHGGRGIYYRFFDQYTKLNIWGLPASIAVYLDADTLVRRNFDELFDMPWTFGAVPDVYNDKRGFTVGFNAGVMVFRPDENVLRVMKSKLEEAQYPPEQAEQAFLNLFFAGSAVRLPYAYNANLAIKRASPALWAAMEEEMRVVHYTLVKPFVDERDRSGKLLRDNERLMHILGEAERAEGGLFKDEVWWWRETYEAMRISEVGDKVDSCRKAAALAM